MPIKQCINTNMHKYEIWFKNFLFTQNQNLKFELNLKFEGDLRKLKFFGI
jgi:hypothetical protein